MSWRLPPPEVTIGKPQERPLLGFIRNDLAVGFRCIPLYPCVLYCTALSFVYMLVRYELVNMPIIGWGAFIFAAVGLFLRSGWFLGGWLFLQIISFFVCFGYIVWYCLWLDWLDVGLTIGIMIFLYFSMSATHSLIAVLSAGGTGSERKNCYELLGTQPGSYNHQYAPVAQMR
eukprot:GDKI01037845.1.p1 GENE.GDKI01037845.1~~GDKI01037845.1.p1  ORF type:complete len:173 (+),score=17.11 GDKI01037845.1:102-620(+)